MSLDTSNTKRTISPGTLRAIPFTLILFLLALPVLAQNTQTDATSSDEFGDTGPIEEVLVTGSRIRRTAAEQMAPIGNISSEDFIERGYVTAAEAMNQFTSNIPNLNQAAGDGSSSGTGQQFPNLFGLGTGRTLTLVNGHRFVTSSVGLGDAQVDANIIPTGLIKRIEVVQAGGAAVYSSGAIAGVVNYILYDDYEGLEIDAQYGDATEGDYEQDYYRVTWGTNFDDNRGNFAINAEYASTPLLLFSQRERSNLSRITQSNPADTGPDDGIPAVREILDAYFWNFNGNGVIYNIPAPPPFALTLVDGHPVQFDQDGSIVPYNPGDILGIPFAQGGDGFRYSELAGLRTSVERKNFMALGHYDVTDNVTLRAEFLYANTLGEEIPQGYPRTVLNGASPPNGAIMIFPFNPFLTPEAVATLTAANPAFGQGAPMWLSRHFYYDLFPTNIQETETDTYFGLVGLDGEFERGNREWYWSTLLTYGQVDGTTSSWDAHNQRFANAIFAVPSANGPACLINVDGDPTNDDPACSPINPFGPGNISPAASEYVSVLVGQDFTNKQWDFLATIGTDLFDMPAGPFKSVFAYEYRDEEANFVPFLANQQGVTGAGIPEVPQSGSYDTNELSVEILMPILGAEQGITGFDELEFNGTYRYVDNSLAGTESVWSAGLRWQVVDSFAFRGTYSRNFRAPTLTQLVAPQTTGLTQAGEDPCDSDRIDGGPNPSVRRANCEAEWAANPQYPPLPDFQDPAENFTYTLVTTGGNPNLENEVSDTTTYGLVFQPAFAEGLTFTLDRIEIDLKDGLAAFTPEDFMASCYDSTPQPADVCGTFVRATEATADYPAGTVIQAIETTYNASIIKYEGEYYVLDYQVPLDNSNQRLSFTLNATHNAKYETSVTGTTFVRLDNTVAQPDWVGQLVARWGIGPVLLSYQLYYLSAVLASPNATIETTPNPNIDSNWTHSLSAIWDVNDWLSLRAGVANLTNEEPSYPTLSHGDIIGRRWWVGASVHFD